MTKIKNLFQNKSFIKFLLITLGVFLIFIVYEIIHLAVQNNLIFPSIGTIFNALFEMLKDVETYKSIGLSLARTLLAIIISFVFGFSLGTLGGLFPKFSYIMKPFVSLCKCIPVPCFVYLLFIYFHSNKLVAIIIVTFMIIFPIIYEGSKTGIENIDENIELSLALEGRNNYHSIFRVKVPLAFPYVILAILSSFGLGIKVEITAEILLGANNITGIGRLLYNARMNSMYENIYAIVILVVIIFIIIDILVHYIKKFMKK